MLLDAGLLNIKSFDLLEVLLSGLMIFVVVYFNNKKTRKDMAKENEEKFEKKADVTLVEKLDRAAHHRMNGIDDNYKQLSTKIDSNHNFMIDKFTELTQAVMRAISKK